MHFEINPKTRLFISSITVLCTQFVVTCGECGIVTVSRTFTNENVAKHLFLSLHLISDNNSINAYKKEKKNNRSCITSYQSEVWMAHYLLSLFG